MWSDVWTEYGNPFVVFCGPAIVDSMFVLAKLLSLLSVDPVANPGILDPSARLILSLLGVENCGF